VGAKSKILDTGKMQRLLPGRPVTPLRAGLETTIRWFDAHWDQMGGAKAA
jgi:hypothetical protein